MTTARIRLWKKSRALSTPAEVDENDNDEEEFADALENDVPTPSPQPSPPLETKTRQLSQGADDTALSVMARISVRTVLTLPQHLWRQTIPQPQMFNPK